MGKLSKLLAASAVIILGGASALLVLLFRKRIKRIEKPKPRSAQEAFDYLDINIVTTVEDCDRVVHELRKRSMNHKALGFDCEWVTGSQGRQPVALLQMSSFDGYCGIFRLSCFTHGIIPNSLRDLLECEDIYKIGVAPTGDARYISGDYQTSVLATIDVRFILELCGYQTGGLAAMTENILNVTLDKRWKIRCSNWEETELSPTQVHYAASDAHAAIRIFVKVLENLNRSSISFWRSQDTESVWERIDEICWQFNDRNYKTKNNGQVEGSKNNRKTKEKEPKKRYRADATRSKPLYHNCFLQAPDGELLCTCDTKKAHWYVEKDLAVLISEDPLTVRLRFEPAGRSVGDVGKYYQMKKENHCVVCGATNSYIRKNIVPREYRKYFPEIMKDHSSHDVLLLCVACHRRSNLRDLRRRRALAAACAAPLAHDCANGRVVLDANIRKVRMAARALCIHDRKHSLPAARRKELEDVVLTQFPGHSELTDAMLQEAATMQQMITNEDFTTESHGYKVVSMYLTRFGGLLKLEEEWRTHFLDTMQPKYMPELWSIHHNRDRLKVKWDEKRLDENDLKSIGVEW